MDTRISSNLARFGKALDVIGKVLAAICFVAAGLTMLTIVIVIFIPDDIILRFLSTFNSGGRPIEVVFPFVIAVVSAKLGVILTLIVGAVRAIVYAVILLSLSALFKSIAVKQTPFTPQIAKSLKVIGIVLIIVSIPLGLGNLVFAFCVFAFAYVIQYGCELQLLSDETL